MSSGMMPRASSKWQICSAALAGSVGRKAASTARNRTALGGGHAAQFKLQTFEQQSSLLRLLEVGACDHARAHGFVADRIDEDEGAGGPVLLVGVEEERLVGLDDHGADLIHLQRSGL